MKRFGLLGKDDPWPLSRLKREFLTDSPDSAKSEPRKARPNPFGYPAAGTGLPCRRHARLQGKSGSRGPENGIVPENDDFYSKHILEMLYKIMTMGLFRDKKAGSR